jgi:hypothetical protein
VGWADDHQMTESALTNTTGDRWLDADLEKILGPTTVSFVPYHTTPWDVEITVGSDYGHQTAGG